MNNKRFDGVELLRKLRDGEINTNTKIRTLSCMGNEYIINVTKGANKFVRDDGLTVAIGYLCNPMNEFEIIEEDKKIEKEDLFNLDESMTKASLVAWQKANNGIFKKKIDELIDKVNNMENK